jgi:hypothetical protein
MTTLTIPTADRGVKLNAPPSNLIPGIMGEIDAAVAALPPETHGAFVTVADLTGVNAAVVAKTDSGWAVRVWVGKDWKGPISAGAQVVKHW